MSFQVSKEILPEQHHARLTVTFDADEFEKAKRRAARELSKRLKIPGFRPGKAPYAVVARRVGEGTIIEEAIDDLLERHYGEILKQAEVEPGYAGALKEVSSLDPLTLVIEVPLAPEVDLGDYKSIRVPYEPPEVTDEEVERTLDNLRRIYISIEPVDRPAEMGDVVVMDLTTTIHPPEGEEGEPQTIEEGETALLVKEADDPEEWPFPGFGKALEGLKAGDEKTLEYVYPADYPDETLRGRKAVYRLAVKEVQAPVIPELNDEFVKENTEFETVDELRAAVARDLQARNQMKYEDDYFRQVLDTLIAQSHIKVPQEMLEEELEQIRHSVAMQMEQAGTTLEHTLQAAGKTKEEFEEELRAAARRNVEQRLVLAELARREGLELSEEELSEAINEALAELFRTEGEEGVRRLARDEQALQNLTVSAISARTFRKAADRLMAIARGEAEAEEAPEAEGKDEATPQPEAEEGRGEAVPRPEAEEAAEAEDGGEGEAEEGRGEAVPRPAAEGDRDAAAPQPEASPEPDAPPADDAAAPAEADAGEPQA